MRTRSRPPEPIEKITRTENPVRRAFHGLICVSGWAAFAYYLMTMFVQPIERDAIPTFLLLLLFAFGIGVVNQLWVRFNLNLHLRLGRRRKARLLDFTARTDKIGRILEGADWPEIRKSAHVRVEIDAGVKRYLLMPPGGETKGTA